MEKKLYELIFTNQEFFAAAINLRKIGWGKNGFDFNGADNTLQLLSLHPGVSVDNVIENTGFKISIKSTDLTPMPASEELSLIREVLDPQNIRNSIFGE